MCPAVRAEEVDQTACAEARDEPLARLVVDALPALGGDRGVAAEEMTHERPRSPPIPSDPSRPRLPPAAGPLPAASSAASALSVMAPGPEKHAFCDRPPLRPPAEQELEIHREVLVLLVPRVLDDRASLGVLLDREPLLVPVDRLGLLGQRREHPGERACLLRELLGRLVVLVEAARRRR